MASLPPTPGKPPKRRVTLRGTVMQDVSQGEERTRKWPSSRPSVAGSKKTKQAKDFATAQIINKYMAPQILTWAHKQVENSPLLPRDVLTMMLFQRLYAFILPDGRILYPMTARSDVSQSLDAVAAQPGETLVRGPNGWEGTPAGNGVGFGYKMILDQTITSPTAAIDLLDITQWSEIFVWWNNVTLSGNGWRNALLSTNGGATWYTTNGDYMQLNTNGTYTARFDIGGHSIGASAGRNLFIRFIRLPQSPTMLIEANINSLPQVFVASPDQVNAIRLYGYGGYNLTGGRIWAAAR